MGTSSSDALVYKLLQLLVPQLSRSIWQEKGHLPVHHHIGRGACLSYAYGLKDRWACRQCQESAELCLHAGHQLCDPG